MEKEIVCDLSSTCANYKTIKCDICKENKGRRHIRMNKTETKYADYLYTLKLAKEIIDYKFESVKLRLADNTFYTPDFLVKICPGRFEFHEVKGFWRDDARVKIKVAAEQFPFFKFKAIKFVKKQMQIEEF